jgi:membrane protein YdbS with pleckstrin-like domain
VNEISKVLNADEKVIWEGRPQLLPYILEALPFFFFGIIWRVFVSFFLIGFIKGHASVYLYLAFSPFALVGLYLILGSFILQALEYRYIWYVITDKRTIVQSGIIGRDFQYADYDKVINAEVKVGVIDKLFGRNSGTISIVTNVVSTRSSQFVNLGVGLLHINDPYNTYTLFKKVSFDIKSDIEYPNELRPKENPGYLTVYNRDQKPK